MTEILPCKHEKSRLIAKDNDAEYIECTACGAILETHELADPSRRLTPKLQSRRPSGSEPGKSTPFDESLSDA